MLNKRCNKELTPKEQILTYTYTIKHKILKNPSTCKTITSLIIKSTLEDYHNTNY